MRLYIVRHGNPEPDDRPDGDTDDDFDPPLTDIGRESVEAMGQWMLDKGEVPNAILASPKLRTQETAEILREAFGLPSVDTKESLGPAQSIRKMVLKIAGDKSITRPMIVSHHETIAHGLRTLNLDPAPHLDMFAEGELRIYKIDRKDGRWKEHLRVTPGDLGLRDYY
jgi:phosphohistidine phosphatase SixA